MANWINNDKGSINIPNDLTLCPTDRKRGQLDIVSCLCVFVCLYTYRRALTQLGSLALFWVCKDFFSFFFFVSVGVPNCDKLLGSARSSINSGVSLRNGAALTAAKHQHSPLCLVTVWLTALRARQNKEVITWGRECYLLADLIVKFSGIRHFMWEFKRALL